MKREYGHTATGFEAQRQISQKRLQCAEFVVNGDAQRLKDTSHRVFISTGAAHGRSQISGRFRKRLQYCRGDSVGVGFVGILAQQHRQLRGCDLREHRTCGLPA